MLSLENLLLFVPTMGLLVILPGPDFALVSKIALFQGRRHGEYAALGVAAGICVHTLLAMFGISAIIASSATLFTLLKYAGAAYLCYIGFMSILQSCRHSAMNAVLEENIDKGANAPLHSRSLWAGFLTNVLNPKAVLLFMVMLPQFISPDRPLVGQFLEMGLVTAFLCLAWYLFLANMLARVRRLFTRPSFQRFLQRLTGGIFILFGLRLALAKAE